MQELGHHAGSLHPIAVYLAQVPVTRLSIQLSDNMYPGRQQMMAQALGSLIPMWETLGKLQPPGFYLAQPWLLWGFV